MLRNFFVIIVGVPFWGVYSSGSIQKRAAPAALHRYRNHESIPEPDWDGKHHFAGSGFRSATLQRNATYSISNAVPVRHQVLFLLHGSLYHRCCAARRRFFLCGAEAKDAPKLRHKSLKFICVYYCTQYLVRYLLYNYTVPVRYHDMVCPPMIN